MKIVRLRETVRVVMNLNGGFTKVVVKKIDAGRVPEQTEQEIPMTLIPEALRKPGSTFVLVTEVPIPSPADDLASLKSASRIIGIEPENDET